MQQDANRHEQQNQTVNLAMEEPREAVSLGGRQRYQTSGAMRKLIERYQQEASSARRQQETKLLD